MSRPRHLSIIPSFFCAALALILWLPGLGAEYSGLDKKNRALLENEAGSLRRQVELLKKKLDEQGSLEWNSYVKNTKAAGTRTQKMNEGLQLHEIAKERRKTSRQYDKLKGEYEILKTRLDQVEWELQELKSKE